MTYREALAYLNSFINYEKQDSYDYRSSFKLDRMKSLASLLGDPQKEIRSVHVAGTKGKGSTAAIIQSILKCAGFKTGLYTSPHLESFRERIRINDSLISEKDISRLLVRIKSAIQNLGGEEPTFFEVYTALCYLYFKEKKVDFAVYEVGLGGRLDATNIIEPLVSVITPISYEHTQKLGNTLTEIAREKAGIIKNDSICVSAPQEKEALEVIVGVCEEKNTRLILVGKDILYEELNSDTDGQTFSVRGLFDKYDNMETRLLGSHQVMNAAAAIGAIDGLRIRGITVSGACVRQGIQNARWEGRFEIIGKKPYVVLDGAQNRASAHVLTDAVKKIFKTSPDRRIDKIILVLGVSKDKDIKGMLEELLPISDNVILTRSRVIERAMEPERINELINAKEKNVALTSTVEEAVDMALSRAGKKDLILITGSLFVVGEAKEYAHNQ